MMRELHLCLHGWPPGASLGPPQTTDDVAVRPLAVSPEQAGTPLATTFDAAYEAIAQLPRLYCEPDGSFVWVSNDSSPAAFHYDGMLYDGGAALAYVELKGHGPLETFDALLSACGWPEQPLMFQLVRQGVFLDERQFRRWANLRSMAV